MKTLLLWATVASLLVAAVVTAESALQTPTYEASAVLLVGQEEQSDGKIHLIPLAPTPERLGRLTHTLVVAIETRPVAEEVANRLGLELSPGQLRDNLTVEPVESSGFIRLSYMDTDPMRATQVVNTVGQVSSERISVKSEANDMTATLYDKASGPSAPVSPKPWRNGLIALVAALALSAALIEARRRVRLNEGRES